MPLTPPVGSSSSRSSNRRSRQRGTSGHARSNTFGGVGSEGQGRQVPGRQCSDPYEGLPLDLQVGWVWVGWGWRWALELLGVQKGGGRQGHATSHKLLVESV